MRRDKLARRSSIISAVLTSALVLAACSGGSSGSSSSGTTATSSGGKTLQILVTNDDGVSAPGINAVVQALRTVPGTTVTVVAPATNQSGTGGKTTGGALAVTNTTTASGYPAKAVAGYPADTIIWAVDQKGLPTRPGVVVSGVNDGANLGPLTTLSGTVGAAKAAASRGIPALAASQGDDNNLPPDFQAGARQVVDWINQHRASLTSGSSPSPALLDNLNVPTCATGSVRGPVQAPVATSITGRDIDHVDCTSTAHNPPDDVAAFQEGFAVISPLNG